MRIQNLRISNFRAISTLELQGLHDTVVIAGPNGCGKSCVFDAIRLLKSAYGGYQPNEWQHFMGEFQININKERTDVFRLFQDRTQPLTISVEVGLSDGEREYLAGYAEHLLINQESQGQEALGPFGDSLGRRTVAARLRHQRDVQSRVSGPLKTVQQELARPSFSGELRIAPNGEMGITESRVLELVFSQYDPHNIGIVDYHGANRNYNREQIGGINLNIESSESRLRQHALYNQANKYQNLKSEMAAGFIRNLLTLQAGGHSESRTDMSGTLQELFTTFFPGKEFLGPKPTPDGGLLFPVKTVTGAEHDIDDLSSGEKEVLYGYLRLRNAAPLNSVLLIDEPELHLNPRLIAGLASFYHRHLGKALGNQLWLVTHSDTLIREAVGQKGFTVFHLQSPSRLQESRNQATMVRVAEDVDRLVVDLVGDLAAYRPGSKIVVFEGGGGSEFDLRMTCNLFPLFEDSVTCVSGGNKRRVSQLYELLEQARQKGHVPARFYAITDADDDEVVENTATPTRFVWDVYHIENYLLHPAAILRVLKDLNLAVAPVDSEEAVEAALRDAAAATVPRLISHRLRVIANRTMLPCLDLGYDPNASDQSAALAAAVLRSAERMKRAVEGALSAQGLRELEGNEQSKASSDLNGDGWKKRFRGRDILRQFIGKHGGSVGYETFRDLIVARMKDAEYKPDGMGKVVDAILSDVPTRSS